MSGRRQGRRSKAREAQARIRGRDAPGGERELTEIQDVILQVTAYATPGLADLARDANISPSTLSSWRRGLRTPPADAIAALAAALKDRAELMAHHAQSLLEVAEDL